MDPQQFETIKTILRNFDQRLNQLEDREIEHDAKILALTTDIESMKKISKSPPKTIKKYVIEESTGSSVHVSSPPPQGKASRKVKSTPKPKAEESPNQSKQSSKLEYSKAQLQSIRNDVVPSLSSETKSFGAFYLNTLIVFNRMSFHDIDIKSRVDFIRQYNHQSFPLCGVLSKSVIGLKDDVKTHTKIKMEKRPGLFWTFSTS